MNPRDITIIRKIVYLWRNYKQKCSYNKGTNNKIINEGVVRVSSRIQINGEGNKIVLGKGSVLLNSLIKIQGNDNEIILNSNSYIQGAEIWIQDNKCVISIGDNSFIGRHTHLACTEDGSKLIVGNDCMISSNVQVRTGDSHHIFDMDDNRINQAQSVFIGDHCWLGEGSKVLKGVVLEGDDIVSTGAIVTKSFGKNMLLGGVPAKVLKEEVNWK